MEEAAFEPAGMGVEAAARHVLGKRGQARQRLLHLGDRLDDKSAGAVAPHQQAVAHEIVDGLAHGHAADIGVIGQIALRRQGVAMIELARLDGVFQRLPQFQIERTGSAPLQAFERQNGGEMIGHAPTSGREPKRCAASATAPVSASASASTKNGWWRSASQGR
ncbi:hypothetical protein D3C72_1926950 [compost metagenome]